MARRRPRPASRSSASAGQVQRRGDSHLRHAGHVPDHGQHRLGRGAARSPRVRRRWSPTSPSCPRCHGDAARTATRWSPGERAEQRPGRDLHRPVQRPAQLLQRLRSTGATRPGPRSGTIAIDPLVQGQYDVYGTHTYPQAGNFTITVDISDGGGGTASVTQPGPGGRRAAGDPAGRHQPRRGREHLHHRRRHVHRPEPVRHSQRFHVHDQLGQRQRQRGPDRRRARRIQRRAARTSIRS